MSPTPVWILRAHGGGLLSGHQRAEPAGCLRQLGLHGLQLVPQGAAGVGRRLQLILQGRRHLVVLLLAGQRLAGHGVVPGPHRLLRALPPFAALPLAFGQLLGGQLLRSHGPGGLALGVADRRLHLPHRLLQHLLRIFKPIDHVVQVRGNDVAEALEQSHVVVLLIRKRTLLLARRRQAARSARPRFYPFHVMKPENRQAGDVFFNIFSARMLSEAPSRSSRRAWRTRRDAENGACLCVRALTAPSRPETMIGARTAPFPRRNLNR